MLFVTTRPSCSFRVRVPQGFTTGTLQNHARKYGVAIDALSFGFRVLHSYSVEEMKEEGEEVPEDGVLVHGLFMDGARWDRDARLLGTCTCCFLHGAHSWRPIHSERSGCWSFRCVAPRFALFAHREPCSPVPLFPWLAIVVQAT